MPFHRPFLAPCLAVAALLLTLLGAADAAADPLQQRIAATLREQGLTGAVWATVAAEGRVATGAAGIRNARSGEALRADDRVQVGSIAKPLLALGLLRLVSQGRLSLDAPLAELLPDLAIQNPWAATDPLRLRHLLDHSAGLDDTRLSQLLSLRAGPDTPLAETFNGRSRDLLHLRSRPGSRSSYSNMGYTLAGMVIETVTGQRYETYLDQQLLRPLGLRDSTFSFLSQEGPQADARLAMGHFEGGVTQAAVPSFLRPAGQFNTTAADMGRLARFLLAGDGLVQGQVFIAPALLRAMGRPAGTEAARAGLAVGYALGLYTRDRHGAVGLCHGGSTIGFRAMLCLYPQQGKAFFMAINTDSESADPAALDKLLLPALALGQSPAQLAPGPGLDSSAWEGWYVPAPNRLASLAWVDTLFGFARLRRDAAGALRFEPFQSPGLLLSPFDGGQLYRAPGRLTASHALLRGADGAHVISTGTQSYEKVSLVRQLLPLWASLGLGLLGLIQLLIVGLPRLPRLLSGRLGWSHPALLPSASLLALLLLPPPLFLRQSFLQLGDLTLASGLLALLTAALPLVLLAGLLLHGQGARGLRARLDALAMLALLQLWVLAAWGLLPLRLWV